MVVLTAPSAMVPIGWPPAGGQLAVLETTVAIDPGLDTMGTHDPSLGTSVDAPLHWPVP